MRGWWKSSKRRTWGRNTSCHRVLQVQQLEDRCLLYGGVVGYSFELVVAYAAGGYVFESRETVAVQTLPVMAEYGDGALSGIGVEDELHGEGEGTDHLFGFELSDRAGTGVVNNLDSTDAADAEDRLSGFYVDSFYDRDETRQGKLADSAADISDARDGLDASFAQLSRSSNLQADSGQEQVGRHQDGARVGDRSDAHDGYMDDSPGDIPDVGVERMALVGEELRNQSGDADSAWPDNRMPKMPGNGEPDTGGIRETGSLDRGTGDEGRHPVEGGSPTLTTTGSLAKVRPDRLSLTVSSNPRPDDRSALATGNVAGLKIARTPSHTTRQDRAGDLLTRQSIVPRFKSVGGEDRRVHEEYRGAARFDQADATIVRDQIFASFATASRPHDGAVSLELLPQDLAPIELALRGFLADEKSPADGCLAWLTRPEVLPWAASVALVMLAADTALQRSQRAQRHALASTTGTETQVFGLFPELFGRTVRDR